MKIKYHYHRTRYEKAVDMWIRIATDYISGMTAQEIAARYKNPITKKPYSRGYIYWVLKKIQALPIKNLDRSTVLKNYNETSKKRREGNNRLKQL